MEKVNISYNNCDKYLFLLIASLAFGGIGGSLTIVRVAAFILIPSFVKRFNYVKSYLKPFLYAFLVFYFYCLLSLVWTPDKLTAGKELLYYPIHFLLFLEILAFGRFARRPLISISLGWLVAVTLTLPIAVWEYISDHHLYTSRYGYSGVSFGNVNGNIIQQHFAAVTFTNMNSYVVFLCFALPFLFYGFMQTTKQSYRRMCNLMVLIMAIICILFNASRGGLITVALMAAVYIIMSATKRQNILLIIVMTVAAALVVNYADSMLTFIKFRASGSNLLQGESRYVIWQNAWIAFKQTYGMGVGVGGMTSSMRSVTKGITALHNMYFEILLQYGVVFFLLFVCYLMTLFRKTINIGFRNVKVVLLMALIPMPIYLIINSGYLLDSAVYALFASITVFADYERS